MPNVVAALKEEIARVSRKATKSDVESLKKTLAQQRKAISELKTRMGQLERAAAKMGSAGRGSAKQARAGADDHGGADQQLRFSAKGLLKLRQRLGISAASMAQLLEVSALSVYKWESGKTRPRAAQVEKIAALRGLGKREAMSRLRKQEEGEGAGKGAKAKKVPAPATKQRKVRAARALSPRSAGRKRAAASR